MLPGSMCLAVPDSSGCRVSKFSPMSSWRGVVAPTTRLPVMPLPRNIMLLTPQWSLPLPSL